MITSPILLVSQQCSEQNIYNKLLPLLQHIVTDLLNSINSHCHSLLALGNIKTGQVTLIIPKVTYKL